MNKKIKENLIVLGVVFLVSFVAFSCICDAEWYINKYLEAQSLGFRIIENTIRAGMVTLFFVGCRILFRSLIRDIKDIKRGRIWRVKPKKDSLPFRSKDGSYAFPKLYFTTNIGQQIFGDSPCTAFLYKDKILFRCNEDGYERNTLELLPGKILVAQRHEKEKVVEEVFAVPFAMLKGRIWKTEIKDVKEDFWRVDIFYQAKNGQTLLIGIEDTGNSKTGFELCERMKRLYSTNVEDIERTEIYGEHIQL